jgi:hypothetical protein
MMIVPVRLPLRRGSAVAGAAVALALLAGCGGGAGSGPLSPLGDRTPFQIALEAPEVTRAAGTSRFALDLEMTSTGGLASELGGDFDTPTVMSGEGTYDYERQIGDARITSSGGGLPTDTQESVFSSNVLYQRAPGETRWHEWDFSGLVNRPVGQYDPAEQLGLLKGVSEDVREVGEAQVRGEDVRHFAITIDPQKLAAESGVVVEGGLTQSALRSVGPMPADVFVDDDGRVRRLEVRMTVNGADIEMPDIPGMTDDSAITQRMQDYRTESRIAIEYFDFGVPVTAEIPAPSMVDSGPAFPIPMPR